jgi:hypothetical protein
MLQFSIISCKKEEPLKPGTSNAPLVKNPESDFNAGKVILRESISSTATIEFHELEDEVMISIGGHIDEDPELLAKVNVALQEKTLADIYSKVFNSENSRKNVPQILLDLDEKYKTNAVDDKNLANAEGLAPDQGEENTETTSGARIDYTVDANWFINSVVRAKSPSSNENEFLRTNQPSAWASRKGYYHVAFGMAASLNSTARFRGWYESCFLFSCSWESNFNVTIQPRYWQSYSWRGNESHKHRKFQVDGNAPEKRIHFGLTWSEDRATSTPPSSSADMSAHITSFSNNYLSWYVKNNGSTTIYNPWVKFTYSGVGSTGATQVDEWQILGSFPPGHTYGDTRYANALSATVQIDSKNLISESNELNNSASRSNSW